MARQILLLNATLPLGVHCEQTKMPQGVKRCMGLSIWRLYLIVFLSPICAFNDSIDVNLQKMPRKCLAQFPKRDKSFYIGMDGDIKTLASCW